MYKLTWAKFCFVLFQLLPRLQDIAAQSQNTSNAVSKKLKEISEELTAVLETQMEVGYIISY